CQQHDNSPTF
nr:immunoglobulin light chain junction region [Macaca mulatta]MOW62412.1 immunoglobulin light chain junction region [Macaca mulatta]MOW62432.1 immunoglobulin light chain junction region [Macaca mulatta]MOW62525.1 immunoglobulin light chain junction region [Macaca mulatta]MOW63366.1 immunoglobulin light chain junction region [Macaca mulatta]